MIVLRFTIGQTTQEIRTPRSEVVVGSDPTADVTLAQAGLAARALRLVRSDTEVELEVLGGERRLTLRVGDIVEVEGVEIALVGLLPPGSADLPAFGGYDDDDAPAVARVFELAEPGPAPTAAAFSLNAPSRAAPPASAEPAATAPETGRRRSRHREAVKAAAAAAAGTSAPTAQTAAPPPLTPEQRAAQLKRLKFDQRTFGDELVAQLRRTPFFALSVGFHLLVFLIIMLFDTTSDEKPLREGPGAVVASLEAEKEELAEPMEELEDRGLPLDEMKLPDLPELEIDDEPPPQDRPEPPSPFKDEIPDPELMPEPVDIGLAPSLRTANMRVRKRRPQMPKVNLRQTFTKGAAGSSNGMAAQIVRAALGRGRYGNGAKVDDIEDGDILVVSGSFDHIHRVLDALRIKYSKKAPWSLTSPKPIDFSAHKVVFWNCGESLGRRRMADIGKRLKRFVREGGYLFTTDWGVANVLPYAFPGYLNSNGNRAHLPEMVLDIEPARSARDHPLLAGVFHPGVKGKWWLEQASFDMSVGRKDAVTVLIESPMLRDSFNRSPAVAATFHHGRGRVLHTMGHYFQEAGNLAGTISAHRLALNFVLMRLDQDRPVKSR